MVMNIPEHSFLWHSRALSFLHWKLPVLFWFMVTLDTSKEAQITILYLPLEKKQLYFSNCSHATSAFTTDDNRKEVL